MRFPYWNCGRFCPLTSGTVWSEGANPDDIDDPGYGHSHLQFFRR